MDRTMDTISLFIDDYFYLIVISLVYWTVNKNIGFKLLIAFAFSVYVHGLIHYTLSKTIPSFTSAQGKPIIPVRDIQVATSFWGYLIPEVSDRRFTIFSCVILLFLSAAAFLNGNHTVEEIGSALFLGAFIVYIIYRSSDWIGSVPEPIILAFCLVLPSSLLLLFPEGAPFAGLLLGGAAGFSLERIKIRVKLPDKIVKKCIAGIIGIAGLVVIGFSEHWFPPTTLLQFLHSSLLGMWITLLHPLFMTKTGLYKQEGNVLTT